MVTTIGSPETLALVKSQVTTETHCLSLFTKVANFLSLNKEYYGLHPHLNRMIHYIFLKGLKFATYSLEPVYELFNLII